MATGLVYDAQFIVDYSGDEPEHQVQLTLNLEDVQELRCAAYDAYRHNSMHVFHPVEAALYAAIGETLQRIEKRLAGPSLHSLGDFKATNKENAA